MTDNEDHIKKSLLKRKEAMERFNTLRESFLQTREQTMRDIEEARKLLKETLEQLPKHHFN